MGHYKSNLRDLQFNLFELFSLEKVLEEAISATSTKRPPSTCCEVPPGRRSHRRIVRRADRNPPVFDPRPIR